ncbi:MAG: hypothetical protein KDA20_08055 [Phycisphaerales bacterium]|nr:hypothetical protein [Phycisphaerales bacterium]
MNIIARTPLRLAVSLSIVLACSGSALGVTEWRTIDGSGNNTLLGSDLWGSAGSQLLRLGGAMYDGDGATPMSNRPNPRLISNTVFAQSASIPNSNNMSDFVWQWGQFLDHDVSLVFDSSGESMDISVPNGDPFFADGTTMPFIRSGYDPGTGTSAANPRQQINSITSWVDASNVYGSDTTRATWLRETNPAKPGQLKSQMTGVGEMLPYNDGSIPNLGGNGTELIVAGDFRANEQVGLTSMHTLFVREHNRLAQQISAADPGLSSDEVYERARRIVGAEVQAITYNEFLPSLVGSHMPSYGGYDDSIDPTIRTEFTTALYRVGHTMLSPELKRLGSDGNPIPEGNIGLGDAFFRPDRLFDEGGIEPMLRGLASQAMQEIDAKVVDGVRNMLILPPVTGLDLASLNMQRGRDHGLPDYNTVRSAYGLTPIASFDDLTTDSALAAALRAAYGQTAGSDNVHLLDVWVGALSEDHMPGAEVGELVAAGIIEQFSALRSGDRFFYLNDADLVSILGDIGMSLGDLEDRLLSDIILDNTSITSIQRDVFHVPAPGAMLLGVLGLGAARRRRSA